MKVHSGSSEILGTWSGFLASLFLKINAQTKKNKEANGWVLQGHVQKKKWLNSFRSIKDNNLQAENIEYTYTEIQGREN